MPGEPTQADRVGALLSRWEALRAAGQTLSPGELCRDCPELTAAVAEQMQALSAFDHAFAVPPTVPRPEPPAPRPPTLPGYEVYGELGRGGMGVVYRARQIALDRPVALKMVLSGARAGPAELARFRHEAGAAARLLHPNIVQVYDFGEHDGLPYFALEFCPGGSLADRLDGTPWPPAAAAALVETLARAMHYAHAQGVVHRDLKPANILLSSKSEIRNPKPETRPGSGFGFRISDFELRISDFGLAKRLDTLDGPTHTGDILGTPSYMAPEQAAGLKEVGPAADVYALSAILYELLTGRPPFRGTTPIETLQQVLGREPVPPARLQPGVPRDLETVCLKGLEKEPRKRYASGAELADELRRFLNHEPVRARRVGPAGRLVRWARRRPGLAAVSGLAAVALVALVVQGIVFAAAQARLRRETGQLLAWAALERGRGLAERGDADAGLVWLARALEEAPADDPELQRVVRAELAGWARALQPLRHVLAHPGPVTSLAFAPGGRTLATGSGLTARLWDARAGQPLGEPLVDTVLEELAARLSMRLPHEVAFAADGRTLVTWNLFGRRWDLATGRTMGAPLTHDRWLVTAAAVSPDGRTAATASGKPIFGGTAGEVRLWDAATGRLRATMPHPGTVWAVAFSPDGGTVVTADDTGAWRWSTESGGPRGRPISTDQPVRALAISPDGRRLLTATSDLFKMAGEARLWDLATGRPAGEPLVRGAARAVAFDRDGRRALVAAADAARLFEADTGRAVGEPLRHAGAVEAVAFSPDGRWALTGSGDGTARVWDATTGRPAGAALTHGKAVTAVAFRPDGAALATASADGTARLWDFQPPRPLPHAGPVRAVAFSPNGRLVLTAGADKTARFWDTATGLAVGSPRPHPNEITAAAYSPDGRFALTVAADTVRLWDGVTGATVGQPMRHGRLVVAAAFSPDSRLIATGAQADQTLRLWDAATGSPSGEPLAIGGQVVALAWAPDGRYLAIASQASTLAYEPCAVQLWEAAARRPVRVPMEHPQRVAALAFNPDGTRLAAGGHDGAIRLWDVATGQPAAEPFRLEEAVQRVAFNPNGTLIAAAGLGRTARLWDVATGQDHGLPLAHSGGLIFAMSFSPDGRWLLTAGTDQTARLWDVATGRPVGAPLEHSGNVLAAAFAPDSRQIATGGHDGLARLWPGPALLDGEPARVAAWARVVSGREPGPGGTVRNLSAAGWAAARQRLAELGGSPLPEK